MKAITCPFPEIRRPRNSSRGVALVIVLAFLVLLSALILGMFTSSRTELASADSYSSGVNVRQLSDMAVGIVQAQLSDGTKSWSVPPRSGKRLTWSTQPGLVRSYDDEGRVGRTFKLFSARNMVEAADTDYIPVLKRKTEILDDWPKRRAEYVDLNEPILMADSNGPINRDGRKFSAQYPILDPSALGAVDGFKLNLGSTSDPLVPEAVPGYGGSAKNMNDLKGGYDPTGPASSPDLTSNPAPMPVTWMYVLANGKVTVPTGSKGNDPDTVYWDSSTDASERPSADNPIVGRIGFWADDESCKLNINTASEGIYWDRPWANSDNASSPFGEKQLARRIPAKNEYNRFPGHPASTSLSVVFAGLLPGTNYVPPSGDFWSKSTYPKFQSYYDLVPRVGYKGSLAGTADTVTNGRDPDYTSVVLDQNRLYASVDELAFRSPDGPDSKGTGGATRVANTGLTRPVLERAKFFLTTSSRVPDLNAFSQPRISLWPLQVDPDPNVGKGGCPSTVRNAKDKLIAACSTIGTGASAFKFYFQRYSIYLREQVNNRAAHSGQPFAQLPGSFAPPSSQQPTLDWTQVSRNRELFAYLQSLTDRKVPGFGDSFKAKYKAANPYPVDKSVSDGPNVPIERDQILTEMIDLARSGVNTYSTDSQLPPRYEYAPARDMPDASTGETQLVPLVPPATDKSAGGTKGFGRFPTITEAALQFYRTEFAPAGSPPSTKQDCIRAVFIPEMASPTCGPASWSPLVRFRVLGLNKLSINNTSGVFLPQPVSLITSRAGYGSGSNHSTAFNGLYMNFRIWNGPGNDKNKIFLTPEQVRSGSYNEELNYPFISDGIPVAAGQKTFSFSAPEDIVVEVYAGYASSPSTDMLVQRLHFKFPSATWKLPNVANKDINARLGSGLGNVIDTTNDMVRSVELDPKGPSGGDIRLLAAIREVPSTFFAEFKGSPDDGVGYAEANTPMVHSLRLGAGAVWGGKTSGRLIPNGAKSPSPVAARNLNGAVNALGTLGDWDNGNGTLEDGAYINKPDEGNAATDDGGYFATGSFVTEKTDTFSPNRQVTSAVMFGSLPTGVFSSKPWQTLLFCPNPVCATNGPFGGQHPSLATGPRDHLLLDLFTMPIVEPYAISEPFSTAGRVNLNYQIAPFTYIHRSTALRGVLKSTRVTAIPNNSSSYKPALGGQIVRKSIRFDDTLRFFEDRFAKNSAPLNYKGDTGAFRSATEICDMPLVPDTATYQNIKDGTWWRGYQLTGDNARETPYAQIYPRVTTKSNVFTVHMRVQTLRKSKPAPGTSADKLDAAASEWNETKDQVLGEYRGSATIERYIDPADPNLPDFAKNPDATMDEFYRFRVVSTKRFTP